MLLNAQGTQFSVAFPNSQLNPPLVADTLDDLPMPTVSQFAVVLTPVPTLYWTDGANPWAPLSYQVIFPLEELPIKTNKNTLAILQSNLTIYYTLNGDDWILIPTGGAGDVSALAQQINSIISSLSLTEGEITQLQIATTANSTAITALNSTVNDMSSNITVIQGKLENNITDIDALKISVAAIPSLSSKINENTNKISNIDFILEGLSDALQTIIASQTSAIANPSGN